MKSLFKNLIESFKNLIKPKVEPEQNGGFVLSRYTVKVKLISIISLIIFASLSGMIFSASTFFSAESEVRIQERNLDLVRATSQWTESEIRYIKEQILLSSKLILAKNQRFSSKFFEQNPEFIYFGISTNGLNFANNIYNRKYMETAKFSIKEITNLHET